MWPRLAVWPYVGCFKHRERPLIRNDAAAFVRVGDHHPERALTQARPHQTGRSVSGSGNV